MENKFIIITARVSRLFHIPIELKSSISQIKRGGNPGNSINLENEKFVLIKKYLGNIKK